MLIWVIYDISRDKTRRKVINICKDNGLYRVQKSVFFGTIEDEEDIEILKEEVKNVVDLEVDSVYIFPMNDNQLNKAGLIGQAFDKELVTDEIISKFF